MTLWLMPPLGAVDDFPYVFQREKALVYPSEVNHVSLLKLHCVACGMVVFHHTRLNAVYFAVCDVNVEWHAECIPLVSQELTRELYSGLLSVVGCKQFRVVGLVIESKGSIFLGMWLIGCLVNNTIHECDMVNKSRLFC